MDLVKHEWRAIALCEGCWFVKQQDFGETAEVVAATGSEEYARLIGAAPDMLEALRTIVAEVRGPLKPFSSDSYLPRHIVDLALAAIDKAEEAPIEAAGDAS